MQKVNFEQVFDIQIDSKLRVSEIVANVRFGSSYGNPQYQFTKGNIVDQILVQAEGTSDSDGSQWQVILKPTTLKTSPNMNEISAF